MTVPRRITRLPDFPTFCQDVLGLDPSTRAGHMTIAKAQDGVPLSADELALFQRYTGRETPRPAGYPYFLGLVGRQCGKTEQAGARLTHAAVGAVLSGQRDVAAVGISQDQRNARAALFQYVVRCFEQPLLRGLVLSQTADTLTLVGNVRVLVLPCRPAAIRGLRCISVVLDEVAHFRSSENVPLDREAWRAALPTLLTTRGKLYALSSPYVASGLAYDLHQQHYGVDSDVLVWSSPSIVLHPGLSEAALDQIRAADPEGADAEIEGQFLQHVATLHDEDTLRTAVDGGVVVRPPKAGVRYVADVDVATGTKATGDRWAVGISHQERGVAILDALLVIPPPFSPETAAQQTAHFCLPYGVRTATRDAFAVGFSDEALKRARFHLEPSPRTTSELHLDFAAMIASGSVRLLDHPGLLAELRGLERHRAATRDRVDHRRGGHDDIARVCAGSCVAAARPEAGSPVETIRVGQGWRSSRRRPDYAEMVGLQRLKEDREARNRAGERQQQELRRRLIAPLPAIDPFAELKAHAAKHGTAATIAMLREINGPNAPLPDFLVDAARKRA